MAFILNLTVMLRIILLVVFVDESLSFVCSHRLNMLHKTTVLD